MSELLERIGVERPVVQAGMGGGLAGAPLAAAVSEAGGLGTIGILPPSQLRAELAAARALTSRPLAVNLLLPFTRRAHRDVAAEADVVTTFWGPPKRPAGGIWLHQCGSVEEAEAAWAAGAEGVIAQGVEAGGHVRGDQPALELLARVRASLPGGYPVLLAGGIADRDDVAAALAAGADAAVLGTRFLLSDESGADAEYRRRVLSASETILTELFGMGWAGQHRVVPNAATERWLAGDRRGPAWLRRLNRVTEPLLRRIPLRFSSLTAGAQRPGSPFLSPAPPAAGAPAALLDAGALYAGESALRIDRVRPAADLVAELSP